MFKQKYLSYFELLYNKTYDRTLKYVVLNCQNMEDVNDIIQDVYIELYKIIIKKKITNIENPSAFIIGIAKNKLKKYYSFKYKLNNMVLFSGDSDFLNFFKSDVDIENIVINDENIKDIWAYLKKKDILIAKIFYLHYYLDMTLKEVGKELKIKESTVKTKLYRTLKEINDVFGRK
ncbi:MAG: sigma-70 family RNA polymerase sigma factor [Bacilli bacterium]|nr:sigma-70 family RNA polymerase sigma factor [Bacilli bacterium]